MFFSLIVHFTWITSTANGNDKQWGKNSTQLSSTQLYSTRLNKNMYECHAKSDITVLRLCNSWILDCPSNSFIFRYLPTVDKHSSSTPLLYLLDAYKYQLVNGAHWLVGYILLTCIFVRSIYYFEPTPTPFMDWNFVHCHLRCIIYFNAFGGGMASRLGPNMKSRSDQSVGFTSHINLRHCLEPHSQNELIVPLVKYSGKLTNGQKLAHLVNSQPGYKVERNCWCCNSKICLW